MKKQRYYNVEGGKVLILLYIIGLIVGTALFNISVYFSTFHPGDYFDFTEYIKGIQQIQYHQYLSYILLIRIKQAFLFFVMLFVVTPYVAFCILVFLLSFFASIFLSAMIWTDSYLGIVKGILFFLPHGICYGMAFVILYRYLFQKMPSTMYYQYFMKKHTMLLRKNGTFMTQIFIILSILLFFFLGCYAEAYINPRIIYYIGLKL